MAEEHTNEYGDPVHPDVHHEERDINIRVVLWFGAGTIVLAILIHLGIWGLLKGMVAFEQRYDIPRLSALPPERTLPPEPRLQPKPPEELHAIQAEEAEVLDSYGWVSREDRVARIPIERAMGAVVLKGLPHAASTPGSGLEQPEREQIVPPAATPDQTEPAATAATNDGQGR